MASQLPEGFVLEDAEPVRKLALPEGFVLEPEEASRPKISEIAGDVGSELGISLAGQGIGAMTGPGYFVIAPASGAYGNYVKQQREIERGERKGLSYGEMVSSALINAIPGGTAMKVAKPLAAKAGIELGKAGAKKGVQVAEQAAIRAAEGTVIGAGTKAVEEAVEENRWPSLDEFYSASLKGAGFGAGIGVGEKVLPQLSKGASSLWSRLSGKTEKEVSQILTEVRNTGTTEQRQAAGEIIDVVGQNLGLVRPSAKAAQESAETLATKSTAEESARALLGSEAVEMAKKEGRLLTAQEQAALRERQAIEQGRLQAEGQAQAASRTVPGGFGSDVAMAGSRPSPVSTISGVEVNAPAVGGFGGTGAQGSAVSYPRTAAESAAVFQGAVPAEAPLSAAVFERAFYEGRTQAGAMGLRYRLAAAERASQARLTAEREAAMRAGDFQKARELESLSSLIEARRLATPEARPSSEAIEASLKPRAAGVNLPTTEDVIQEFQNVPGIGGRAGARRLVLGASAPGAAAIAEYAAPVDSYEISHPDPRIGTLRYSAKDWTEDKILQDINKKEIELLAIDVSEPQLRLREQFQQIQDRVDRGELDQLSATEAQINLMKQTPLTTEASAMAARVASPMIGEGLLGKRGGAVGRAVGRVGGGMLGEVIGSRLEGEPASLGTVLGAGVAAAPEGKSREFAKNLLKFVGAELGEEVTKEAIDRKALLSFKQAAAASAEGGASAAGMKLFDKVARKAAPVMAKRGEYELIKTMAGANEIGLIVDPTIYANAWPRNLAMTMAGGNTKFQEAASRVNYPRVVTAVEQTLGVQPGTSFGRSFFLEQREILSEPYKKIAAVSKKAASALEDWKAANEDVVANVRAAAEPNVKNRSELRQAARRAREDADKAFDAIQVEAYATGNGHLVKDLTESRKQLSRMYAIKAATNEASGKIEYPKVWGEMYDVGVPFDGNLEKLARVASTMPEVLTPPMALRRQAPIKDISKARIGEMASNVFAAPYRAAVAVPQRMALEAMLSSPAQRAMLLPPSGRQVSVPAQLGRFLTAEAMESVRPAPYR